jgi:hypothetical protein
MGVGGDSEKTIRWLIALMVLRCDALAITLARRRHGDQLLPKNPWASISLLKAVPG